jgi:hypothetical protein
MNRRNLLKTLSITLGAGVISTDVLGRIAENAYSYQIPENPLHQPLAKPITVITLGGGNRGTVYGNYAATFPDQIKIVGVAEPIPYRNEKYAKKHNIPANMRFNTWEDVLSKPKMADAVIISMPDNLHYEPCMKALAAGYDILLEKPIAPTEKECRNILALAKRTGRIVAVCHVLRYAPYFVKMKELIEKGAIGEVISVQHFEPIEHTHMAHSYVRGNWHNSKETSPIILAKSCHDLDIVKWVINKKAEKIVAMGDLKWFKQSNAPEGSTARCTDGCKVERACPYSAIKEYVERGSRISVLDIPEGVADKKAAVLEKLKTTNYGRCVYRMDNDQPDHYVTSIQFSDSVTASFSMEAFCSYHGRRTRVMGSMGDMVGDMTELVLSDFKTRKDTKFIPKAEDVEGYKKAVSQQNASLLTSTIDESIESHIMGFMAEKSRVSGKVMEVKV